MHILLDESILFLAKLWLERCTQKLTLHIEELFTHTFSEN